MCRILAVKPRIAWSRRSDEVQRCGDPILRIIQINKKTVLAQNKRTPGDKKRKNKKTPRFVSHTHCQREPVTGSQSAETHSHARPSAFSLTHTHSHEFAPLHYGGAARQGRRGCRRHCAVAGSGARRRWRHWCGGPRAGAPARRWLAPPAARQARRPAVRYAPAARPPPHTWSTGDLAVCRALGSVT